MALPTVNGLKKLLPLDWWKVTLMNLVLNARPHSFQDLEWLFTSDIGRVNPVPRTIDLVEGEVRLKNNLASVIKYQVRGFILSTIT